MPTLAYAEVSERVPSLDRALAAVVEPGVGGVALFVGVVRNNAEGRSVTTLDYSSHPSAQEALESCARAVLGRHEVRRIAVEHRLGLLAVGDVAVVVAVGAAHRGTAFDACRDLIDTLKATVPIWKHEAFADGGTAWVGV